MSFVANAIAPKRQEAPPPTPAPTPAPTPVVENNDTVKKAKSAQGRNATNITGAGGVTEGARVMKTTLGS